MTQAELVAAYFAAIRARDVDGLRALFADDAELVTMAGTFVGPDAIAGFYRDLAFKIDDLWPEPEPPLVDGDRVAVEIQLRTGGRVSYVGDFFSIVNGQITRLLICNGPELQSG
jgi:ketosteroid isomerase-like protein